MGSARDKKCPTKMLMSEFYPEAPHTKRVGEELKKDVVSNNKEKCEHQHLGIWFKESGPGAL